MNAILKTFLSMSLSGSLLILILLSGKRFMADKISRQWRYYIWLIVILRLLLPFGPETNLMGIIGQAVDQMTPPADFLPRQNVSFPVPEGDSAPDAEQNDEGADGPAAGFSTLHRLRDMAFLLVNHIWVIWLAAAMGMLIRKVTIYQEFIRYIDAGLTPVSDVEMLDRLSVAAEQAGVKRPVELCVNPLIATPLLTGFFHPRIVLPDTDISERDFGYIVLHELMHYKRMDMLYKWLVQMTICLHWFNPLVHLMGSEITRACEFSCDEAVLAKTGYAGARDYGKTLLDAMAAIGRSRENPGVVSLSNNKQLLKERLYAIMNFRKKSAAVHLLTGVLTLCVILGAAFAGVYPVSAASGPADRFQISGDENAAQAETDGHNGAYSLQMERYYETGSIPLFRIAFSLLDEEGRKEWLDRIYTDKNMAFASAAAGLLDGDCGLIQGVAKKAYGDDEIAFFSGLIMYMDDDTLEMWLERALEDGKPAFRSVLFQALDRNDKSDELEEKQEKKWEEAQRAEYQAVGVTTDGRKYYYQGQPVNIFLDIRANKSFYTLDMNPGGTVNIRIIRDADNAITGVAYLTEEEIWDLFGDDGDPVSRDD